ncbi:hypothetical protein DGo_CA2366 [Deinococcus gobiensis I-0]|uniref:Uncharacterized protein n=1 Tax=Deinococcus gobiensis (strain DSM 21396 / JCM 16679 / CGMCC 1.7299 / I-0) TaxID=745776 RepID=H8GZY1_DEIGI|nr:hypothetical protein DGo_CA2366 [Deinococcus gobiensis I-0]
MGGVNPPSLSRRPARR